MTCVNYLDRANLALAGTAIHKELGLSTAEMGIVFSLFG
ncbi:hypothetical protein BVIET440_80030 [Burkholderia vietnamiensis]|nr:hypothetical protein BVI1335_750009 [Burkholderia vietnamiensis]